MTFEVRHDIEIEFYKPTLIWFADEKTYATKIGISDVFLVNIGYLVSIITNDYDKLIIATLSDIKSIQCVNKLSVNQFGEPISKERKIRNE